VLGQGGGQGPIQVGEAAKQAAQQPDLDAVGQDLGIELVNRDRGGAQPGQQLGWGASAARAVAAQEGGQAGLATRWAAWAVNRPGSVGGPWWGGCPSHRGTLVAARG
jgi:hypothetical protein